jgi:hypothetical protein
VTLVLILLGLCAIDVLIWIGLFNLANSRGHPSERAALKAAAIAIVFSPGLLLDHGGGILVPAILALLSGGEDWKFHASSLGCVFTIGFLLIYGADSKADL